MGPVSAKRFAPFPLDGLPLVPYYTHMSNTPDYTTDLPDNFDPSWDEPIEQEGCEDWRDEDAFTSAGWGTDESYAYIEDYDPAHGDFY